MSELSLNTFLEEKDTKTRKVWTREEDSYIVQFAKYTSHKQIGDFFGISAPAVQMRISNLVRNTITKYKNPRTPGKTKEEMEDFLQFLKAKADFKYSKSLITEKKKDKVQEPDNELSDSYEVEPISTYQITSAEVISITRGEVIIGNYKISGSFSLTVI